MKRWTMRRNKEVTVKAKLRKSGCVPILIQVPKKQKKSSCTTGFAILGFNSERCSDLIWRCVRLGKKVREWSHLGPQQAWPCYPDLRARKVMLMWIQVYQPGSRTHTGFFALSKRVLMKTGKVLLSSRNCNKGSAVHVKSCQMLSSDGGKYTGHMK